MAALKKDKILRYQAEIKESQAVLTEITSGDIEEAIHNPRSRARPVSTLPMTRLL